MTTAIPATISERLRQSEERLRDISRNEEQQAKYLADTGIKTAPSPVHDLEDTLDRIEKTIVNVSGFCVSQLITFSQQIEQIQVSVQQVEGSLSTIRANAGRSLVTIARPISSRKLRKDAFLPRTVKLDLRFPSGQFELNVGVYRGVGNRIEDAERRPLIKRFEPGESIPTFWSRTNDFFITESRDNFRTSFSEFYGFDGAGCFAVPQPLPSYVTQISAIPQKGETAALPSEGKATSALQQSSDAKPTTEAKQSAVALRDSVKRSKSLTRTQAKSKAPH
jgi:hypothetical protein